MPENGVNEPVVTLNDALQNVDLLDDCLSVFSDEQPCIDPLPLSICYQANFDTNFEDRSAFISGCAKYNEEATVHAQINAMIEKGNQFAAMLYTWRSCSRCIPQVKDPDQPNKMEIYEKTIQVLEKEVNKLFTFMLFVKKQAVERFAAEVRRLSHKERRKGFVSEAYYLALGRFMNMFAVMDALKNMKSSVKNDYTHYKRSHEFMRRLSTHGSGHACRITPILSIEEAGDLSMFLAENDVITSIVKKELIKNEGYEELLCDIISASIKYYEEKLYLVPDEKHMLLKVIGFSLSLMPTTPTANNIYKLAQRGRLNLQKIDRYFREIQVVTLYGDMQIPLGFYIERMKDYAANAKHWTCVDLSINIRTPIEQHSEPPQSSNYNLSQRLILIRKEHVKFISELSHKNNRYQVISYGDQGNSDETRENNRETYNLALRGLRLLAKWTCQVMEIYSWKLAHPTNHKENKNCPKDAEQYERATRYNYTSDEKFAMVELLGMIKGLQVLMQRMDGIFTKSIKMHIYAELQSFVQLELRELLRVASKKKKSHVVKTMIESIRSTCGDWPKEYDSKLDPAMKGDKDIKTKYQYPKLNQRPVGPSSTQLYMVRTMLESLISGEERKHLKPLLDPSAMEKLEEFHRNSFFYTRLLNFSETLLECCDLSQLWYREFFLELTMGKHIQFPIEMSMPWILTDHILETREPSMMEFVLYPLDLYSDSAQYALTKFKKRFLYDEIEAELNLCFDQFVVKLSDQIFLYYKQIAAFSLLDQQFKNSLPDHLKSKLRYPSANKYDSLLKQRHIQLLGRSIDLNRLIRQRIQQSLQSSIEYALDYFDAQQSLSAVFELEQMLNVNKLTHSYLQEFLQLDSFNVMLREASYSVANNFGIDRIAEQVFWELTQRVLPHYCYNSSTNRFIPSQYSTSNEDLEGIPNRAGKFHSGKDDRFGKHALAYGSKTLNDCYKQISKVYSGFIGPVHFQCMCRLLGYQGIAFIIDYLFDDVVKANIQTQIARICELCLDAFQSGQHSIKRPRSDYGSLAVATFYLHHLKDMVIYTHLKTKFLPKFQELGNAIVFAMMIEQALNLEEISDLLLAAPFQQYIPPPPLGENETLEDKVQALKNKYRSLDFVKMIETHGTTEQYNLSKDGDIVTRERLCCGLSIFDVILEKIRGYLLNLPQNSLDGVDKNTENPFIFNKPDNVILQTCETKGFHKLWSAIQFALIAQQSTISKSTGKELSDEALFGDSIYWAAGTIIQVLDQQRLFDAFDFSYHVRQVFSKDMQKHGNVENYDILVENNLSLGEFSRRTYTIQSLLNEIFATLKRVMKQAPDQSSTKFGLNQVKLDVFKPPKWQPTQ